MQMKHSVCYDKNAEEIIRILNQNGYEAYYVGGCVRDALMGNVPHDFDIATNALPEQTKRIFWEKGVPVIETGIQHGTISVLLQKQPYEITTFRTDGEYLDHRRPESVTFVRSLKQDLARRDFTMNALAFHREEGVLDFFEGQKDLQNHVIRCVGEPETRFREDALRILRALRFAAVLDFTIERNTAAAIHSSKELLRMVSPERICAEFSKIMMADRPSRVLREYIDVFGIFLPELLPSVGFQQNNPWHRYDVFEHTMVALEHTPCDLPTRLAVLFHDIGKPYVYTQDSNGIGHFKGHAALSETLAKQMMMRLKFDRKTRDTVCLLVLHHDDRIPNTPASVKRLIRRLGKQNAIRVIQVEIADHAAQNSAMVAPRQQEAQSIERMIHELAGKDAACITYADLAVNGTDILEAGVPQGRQVGKLLAMLLETVTEEKLPNEREALLQFIQVNKDCL